MTGSDTSGFFCKILKVHQLPNLARIEDMSLGSLACSRMVLMAKMK